MGITHVTTLVYNLEKSEAPYEAEFLVDTGAIDCMVSAKHLQAAGVTKESESTYELANGALVKYPLGFARVSFMGQETVAQVVFGPDDIEPILGVVVLENLGFVVDPISKSLKRLSVKPMK